MDRGGRVAQSLVARLDRASADAMLFAHRKLLGWARKRANRLTPDDFGGRRASRLLIWRKKLAVRIMNARPVRGVGLVASLMLFVGVGVYGARIGDRWADLRLIALAAGDTVANSLGFQVAAVQLSGENQVSREEIFAAAGIGEQTSVLFFDPVGARERLKALPWIREATVQKLYPDRLQINVVERQAFALWQRAGKIAVIDADGTVIAHYLDPRFQSLPLLVGQGADARAKEIVDLLRAHPALAEQTRAAVLVAERRWNLRLKNGIDVKLPETDVAAAIARLMQIDARDKALTRDVASIDLRLPDKVVLRLSDDAFAMRDAALKERVLRNTRKKGTDA